MMPMPSLRRKRQLIVESLEARRPLAAYISEIHFAQSDQNQYIELRSEPNATLGPNTYLVVVQSSDGVRELGDIRAIFNLSDQAVGENGMLVLMQSAGGYTVDPQARVVRGSDGFVGMPDGIYQSDSNSKSFGSGSTSFLLIQSASAPLLTNDIDGNDDGIPDGAYLGWSVIDSVAVYPWVESVWSQKSYAQITFRERNVGDVMAGTTSVATDQLSYVARINRSTGSAANDWVAGNVSETPLGSWRFQLQHGVAGTPRPYAYGGRFLDHIGSENWVGAISGAVFEDANSDGIQQAGELAVAGATIRISADADTLADYDLDRITPNEYPVNTDVSNASPYVTIVAAGSNNVHQSFKVRVVQRPLAALGEHIFSHEGVGFFNENRRMRMDFYSPARSISITIIGDSNFTATYGRLEMFNANGQSLGFVRSRALGSGQQERLTVSSPNNDIAWAVAYSEDSYLSSSPFGMLDDLEVVVKEKVATTDANGKYVMPSMPNDRFHVRVVPPPTYDQVFPANLSGHNVNVSGNQVVPNINFGLIGNRPPVLENDSFQVSELLAAGELIGTLPTTLGYPSQQLRYTITSGDPSALFSIDGLGQIKLDRAELDFESTPRITLNVKLEDVVNPALNDTAIIELLVEDGNEPPRVATQSRTLVENSAAGTVVATMSAVDFDAGLAGEFTWSLAGGNSGNAFAINPSTGVVTVSNPGSLDFEQQPVFNLLVRATDKGTPPRLGQETLTINLSNVNEPPAILTQSLSTKENGAAGSSVGRITAQDPDQGQQLAWTVLGGTGQSRFVLSSTTGEVTVAGNAVLDFESQSQYTLLVSVTDSATPALTATATVTIALTDENDAPRIQLSDLALDENVPGSTVVGSAQVSDQDVGQTLTLSLSGADASSFVINSSGEIRTASSATLDFETKSQYVINVVATDNGTPEITSQSPLTITVRNLNEAPVITTSSLTIPENSTAGQPAGQFQGSDPDALDEVTWTIVSQTQNWVTIDASSGNLTVATGAVIDFEGNNSNQVVVRLTDKAGLQTVSTVTISAADRNDPPKVGQTLPAQNAKVNEPFSYALPAGMFSDPDAGDVLSIFVTLASGFPIPGWLTFDSQTQTLAGTPGSNQAGALQLNVTAIDTGGASAASRLTINVAPLMAWHNPAMALDVSGDTRVTSLDALLVINHLNTKGAGAVPANTPPTDGYLDTSADNSVTALDVLLIINELNQRAAGEGELAVDTPDTDALRRERLRRSEPAKSR